MNEEEGERQTLVLQNEIKEQDRRLKVLKQSDEKEPKICLRPQGPHNEEEAKGLQFPKRPRKKNLPNPKEESEEDEHSNAQFQI